LDPWLGFVNEHVREMSTGGRQIEQAQVRRALLDRTACSFPFPLDVRCRGVVAERRECRGQPHLLVEPSRMSRHALDILGGLLVPCSRGLMPDAVVDVECRLADPDDYHLGDGVLAIDATVEAIVPLEP